MGYFFAWGFENARGWVPYYCKYVKFRRFVVWEDLELSVAARGESHKKFGGRGRVGSRLDIFTGYPHFHKLFTAYSQVVNILIHINAEYSQDITTLSTYLSTFVLY